ncbi:MAG: DUF882 domain-containing protein [Minicystis sp.]
MPHTASDQASALTFDRPAHLVSKPTSSAAAASTPLLHTGLRARLSKRGAAWIAAILLTCAPAVASAEITHVVAKGQTLGRIAKRYRVSVEAIREANNLKPGERIHPGLSLVIPEKGKEGEAAKRAAERNGKKDKGKPEKGEPRGKKGKGKKDEAEDKGDVTFSKGPKRRGFVRMARGTEKLEVQLLGKRGHLAPAALSGLSRILRFYPTGEKTAIDPRLAALIGQVSDHFGGKPIRVVSGYRPYTPAQYTPHSNHNLGRAMNFSIDGVPATVLRDYCRTFRNAGVGYYPNSTFVHLDVRPGKAYWVDYSRPGEAPHYDSPNAQHGAEEGAGDGEPHPGAGAPSADDGTPAPGPPAGSNETP